MYAIRSAHPAHPTGPDDQRDPLPVARGRIVHPTSSGVPIFDRDDIIPIPIPITDLPPLPLGLAWATIRENPGICALDETARALTTAPDTDTAAQRPGIRASR